MQSQRLHHRSKWHHCNTPEALRRRRAANDARREAIAAALPWVDNIVRAKQAQRLPAGTRRDFKPS